MTTTPSVLLLGCGYTLSNVARALDPGSFIVTGRSQVADAKRHDPAWLYEAFSIESPDSIVSLLNRYPSINTIVDSIPPFSTDLGRLRKTYAWFASLLSIRNIRLLYLSTTGVFGVDDGSWVDEQTPTHPQHAAGAARLCVEQVYRERVLSTILRLPAIYGPGRGIGHALQNGRYVIISDALRWTNRIHVEDLASVIVQSISSRNLPEILCVSDDQPTLQREVVDFYCSTFNLPFPRSLTYAEAKTTLHHSQLSNQRIKNTLLKEVLKYAFLFPSYREGASTEWTID